MRVESGPLQGLVDPFASETSLLTTSTRRSSQRYSAFDNQLFSQSQSTASPGQAKRALEAHLSETDRRLEEASKLGTALVQQRKDLADRIKEVEAQQSEHEIGPELRQKLIDVEREFNEIGRDSARAFLAPRTPGGPLSEVRVSGQSLLVCVTYLLTIVPEPRQPNKILQSGDRFSIKSNSAIAEAAQPAL